MIKETRTLCTITMTCMLLASAGCVATSPSPPDDSPAAAETPAAANHAPAALSPEDKPAAAVLPATTAVKPEAATPTAPVISALSNPNSESPKPAKPAVKAPAKPVATPTPAPKSQNAAAAPLAMDTLEQRLKDTPAIGVFTKLTLKNQVDDLLNRFRAHYEGRGGMTIPQLRQNYEQLLAKVHGLLKDGDPGLASAIIHSREAIWSVLTDPVKFAKL
jgi:hypothetical protein